MSDKLKEKVRVFNNERASVRGRSKIATVAKCLGIGAVASVAIGAYADDIHYLPSTAPGTVPVQGANPPVQHFMRSVGGLAGVLSNMPLGDFVQAHNRTFYFANAGGGPNTLQITNVGNYFNNNNNNLHVANLCGNNATLLLSDDYKNDVEVISITNDISQATKNRVNQIAGVPVQFGNVANPTLTVVFRANNSWFGDGEHGYEMVSNLRPNVIVDFNNFSGDYWIWGKNSSQSEIDLKKLTVSSSAGSKGGVTIELDEKIYKMKLTVDFNRIDGKSAAEWMWISKGTVSLSAEAANKGVFVDEIYVGQDAIVNLNSPMTFQSFRPNAAGLGFDLQGQFNILSGDVTLEGKGSALADRSLMFSEDLGAGANPSGVLKIKAGGIVKIKNMLLDEDSVISLEQGVLTLDNVGTKSPAGLAKLAAINFIAGQKTNSVVNIQNNLDGDRLPELNIGAANADLYVALTANQRLLLGTVKKDGAPQKIFLSGDGTIVIDETGYSNSLTFDFNAGSPKISIDYDPTVADRSVYTIGKVNADGKPQGANLLTLNRDAQNQTYKIKDLVVANEIQILNNAAPGSSILELGAAQKIYSGNIHKGASKGDASIKVIGSATIGNIAETSATVPNGVSVKLDLSMANANDKLLVKDLDLLGGVSLTKTGVIEAVNTEFNAMWIGTSAKPLDVLYGDKEAPAQLIAQYKADTEQTAISSVEFVVQNANSRPLNIRVTNAGAAHNPKGFAYFRSLGASGGAFGSIELGENAYASFRVDNNAAVVGKVKFTGGDQSKKSYIAVVMPASMETAGFNVNKLVYDANSNAEFGVVDLHADGQKSNITVTSNRFDRGLMLVGKDQTSLTVSSDATENDKDTMVIGGNIACVKEIGSYENGTKGKIIINPYSKLEIAKDTWLNRGVRIEARGDVTVNDLWSAENPDTTLPAIENYSYLNINNTNPNHTLEFKNTKEMALIADVTGMEKVVFSGDSVNLVDLDDKNPAKIFCIKKISFNKAGSHTYDIGYQDSKILEITAVADAKPTLAFSGKLECNIDGKQSVALGFKIKNDGVLALSAKDNTAVNATNAVITDKNGTGTVRFGSGIKDIGDIGTLQNQFKVVEFAADQNRKVKGVYAERLGITGGKDGEVTDFEIMTAKEIYATKEAKGSVSFAQGFNGSINAAAGSSVGFRFGSQTDAYEFGGGNIGSQGSNIKNITLKASSDQTKAASLKGGDAKDAKTYYVDQFVLDSGEYKLVSDLKLDGALVLGNTKDSSRLSTDGYKLEVNALKSENQGSVITSTSLSSDQATLTVKSVQGDQKIAVSVFSASGIRPGSDICVANVGAGVNANQFNLKYGANDLVKLDQVAVTGGKLVAKVQIDSVRAQVAGVDKILATDSSKSADKNLSGLQNFIVNAQDSKEVADRIATIADTVKPLETVVAAEQQTRMLLEGGDIASDAYIAVGGGIGGRYKPSGDDAKSYMSLRIKALGGLSRADGNPQSADFSKRNKSETVFYGISPVCSVVVDDNMSIGFLLGYSNTDFKVKDESVTTNNKSSSDLFTVGGSLGILMGKDFNCSAYLLGGYGNVKVTAYTPSGSTNSSLVETNGKTQASFLNAGFVARYKLSFDSFYITPEIGMEYASNKTAAYDRTIGDGGPTLVSINDASMTRVFGTAAVTLGVAAYSEDGVSVSPQLRVSGKIGQPKSEEIEFRYASMTEYQKLVGAGVAAGQISVSPSIKMERSSGVKGEIGYSYSRNIGGGSADSPQVHAGYASIQVEF